MAFEFPANLEIPPPEALKNLSATQHKLYTLCERKWAFSYIHKLRGPTAPHLELGSALHKQIEEFYLKGLTPKANLAQEALKHLPTKGSGLIAIEKPMEDPAVTVGGLPWLGYIDILFQRFGDTKRVSIYDHKSTKSLGWALTPAQLRDDVQLMTYAHWASKADDKVEHFDLFHTYLVTTTERQVEQVPATVDRAHVERAWTPIENKGKEMVQVGSSGTTWETAVPNYEACGAFGGCQFRNICDKKKSNHGGGIFSSPQPEAQKKEGSMSLADRMKANGAVVSPPPPPVVATMPPPAPATTAANLAANVAKVEGATGVLPPDAPAQGPGVVAAPPPEHSAPKRGPGRPRKVNVAEGGTVVSGPATGTPVTEQGVVTNTPVPVSTPAPVVVSTPMPVSTPAMAPQAVSEGFILCLDALPMPGAPGRQVALEVLLGNLAQKVAEQKNIASIFQLQFHEPRTALTAALKTQTFDAAVYTFSGQGLFRDVVMEVMAPKARMVIFGNR